MFIIYILFAVGPGMVEAQDSSDRNIRNTGPETQPQPRNQGPERIGVRRPSGNDNDSGSPLCDKNYQKFIPLPWMQKMTAPDGGQLEIHLDREHRKIIVSYPKILANCLKIKTHAQKIPGTNNVVIALENELHDSKNYFDCLKNDEINVSDSTDKVGEASEARYDLGPLKSFSTEDLRLNPGESIKVFLANPKDHPFNPGDRDLSRNFSSDCDDGERSIRYQQIKGFLTEEDRKIKAYVDEYDNIVNCDDCSIDERYKRIVNALNDLGNLGELQSELLEVERKLREEEEKKRKEFAEQVFSRMREAVNDTDLIRRLLANPGFETQEAKDLANEYGSILEDYEKYVLNPLVQRLDNKIKEYASNPTEAAQKEIRDLNEEIGRLHEEADSLNLKELYNIFAKHGLSGTANKVERLRLGSEYYSRVYDRHSDRGGRGTRIASVATARRKVGEFMQKNTRPLTRELIRQFESRTGRAVHSKRGREKGRGDSTEIPKHGPRP